MMALTKFEKLIKIARSQPVRWWMLVFSKKKLGTQEACAYELTQFAIKKGLVQSRAPIPGNTLNDWVKSNKAPYWAAQSAMLLCLQEGWKPCSDDEWAVFAHLLVRRETGLSRATLVEKALAFSTNREKVESWISTAVDYGESFAKIKNSERKARLSADYKSSVALQAITGSVASVAQKEGLERGQLQSWVSIVSENLHLLFDDYFHAAIKGLDGIQCLSEKINRIEKALAGESLEAVQSKRIAAVDAAEIVLRAMAGESTQAIASEFSISESSIKEYSSQTNEQAKLLFDRNFIKYKSDSRQLKALSERIEAIESSIINGGR